MLAFLQVFLERIGCFSVEQELINLPRNQEPPFEWSDFVQACGSVAWSRGLRVFAVHNGSECLGYSNGSAAILPRLNVSRGCMRGRGGQNVTDVYRFTSKKALLHSTASNEWLFFFASFKLSIHHFIHLSPAYVMHSFLHPFSHLPIPSLVHHFESINHLFIHSFS